MDPLLWQEVEITDIYYIAHCNFVLCCKTRIPMAVQSRDVLYTIDGYSCKITNISFHYTEYFIPFKSEPYNFTPELEKFSNLNKKEVYKIFKTGTILYSKSRLIYIKSVLKIQRTVREWLDRPTYSNGKIGFGMRKSWEEIEKINNIVTNC